MKKILFAILFLTALTFAQEPIRSYSDSLYFGDSTNTHLFANPHSWLRVTVTSDTSADDTVYVLGGTATGLLARVDVISQLNKTQATVISGAVVTGEASRRVYWVYAPGGFKYVKLYRGYTLSKIHYTIESFN